MTVAVAIGLWFIAAVAFTVEGVIGFGSTIITVSLGSQLVALDRLLLAFVPLNMVLSAWLLLRGRKQVAWRVLAVEIAPAVTVGMVLGMGLSEWAPRAILQLIFASFIVLLAATELWRAAVRPTTTVTVAARPLSLVARLAVYGVGGIAHGLFAIGGPPITYGLRRTLSDKGAFRATLAMLWLSLNTMLIVNWSRQDAFAEDSALLILVLAPALVPGAWLGERLHQRLAPQKFERLVWSVLLIAALALVVRSALAV